jgi:hypothetical protein
LAQAGESFGSLPRRLGAELVTEGHGAARVPFVVVLRGEVGERDAESHGVASR